MADRPAAPSAPHRQPHRPLSPAPPAPPRRPLRALRRPRCEGMRCRLRLSAGSPRSGGIPRGEQGAGEEAARSPLPRTARRERHLLYPGRGGRVAGLRSEGRQQEQPHSGLSCPPGRERPPPSPAGAPAEPGNSPCPPRPGGSDPSREVPGQRAALRRQTGLVPVGLGPFPPPLNSTVVFFIQQPQR